MKVRWMACLIAICSTPALAGGLELPERKFQLEHCLQAALEKIPGKVKSAELEVKGGIPQYEFEIESLIDGKTWEVECSGETGLLGEIERDVERDDPAFAAAARLTLQEAVDRALARHPGHASEVEFEISPDGGAWYEISILSGGRNLEVTVNAATGEIMEVKDEADEQEIYQIGGE